jgi:tetratricopeptide (TPR) repeat protein
MRERFDAVGHLLRHLHDAAALRANPIAARYFSQTSSGGVVSEDLEADALTRVHAAVSAAVELVFVRRGDEPAAARTCRQRAIVERCDLLAETHAKVAADLGLSRREFYRERKRARERLAEYFARVEQHSSVQGRPNEFELALAFADSLRRLGRHDAAVASMEALSGRAGGAFERIRVNVALAATHCDVGRIDAAHAAIGRAREIYDTQARAEPMLMLEIEVVSARALWMSGKPAEEVESKNRWVLAQLRSPALLRTDRTFELEALSLMRLGMLRRDIGDASASLTFLRRAEDVLRSLPKPPPALKAELLGNLGLTLMVAPNGLSAAAEALHAYLDFSREHNLLCDTADALSSLATLHLQFGDVARARAFARSGLDFARLVSSKQQLAEVSVIAALAEAEGGDPKASLELIAQARADAVLGSPGWVLTELAEAQVLLSGRAYQRAWRVATEAAELMSALGMVRYAGAALRIAAEAAEGANRHDDAVRTIREAVRILEKRGHATSLARAYACSARLTHNRRDAQRARALLESLHPPDRAAVVP